MAGATNRALKAAGVPKGAIKTIRVTGGRGVSLRSAIGIAQSHGIALPDKVHAHLAKRDGKAAQKSESAAEARRAENAAFEAQHKARTEARHIYEGQNREALGAMQDLRARVRANVEHTRRKQNEYDQIKREATAKAERDAGKAKRGAVNEVRRNRAVEVAVANNPAVQRAAAEAKQARASLQSALASRNATATARKQQRGAEAGGQQDLFSGAPAPRAPSPFERRMALRDARVAMVGRLGQSMMAARKSGEVAKRQAESKAKEDAQRAKDRAEADAYWGKAHAEHAAKKASAERQAATAKRVAPILGGVARNMMAARRQQAAKTAAAAGAAERARTAATAAAIDRGADASRVGKHKIEKNVTVHVAHNDGKGGITKVPVKAIVKAGDLAAVKDRFGYNITHLPTGLTVNSSLPKNVAIQAIQGMASGRGARAMSAKVASWEKGGAPMSAKVGRTARAVERYMQITNKRGAAYELQSARDAHARATAGGNPTVIKAAMTRLNDAEKAHERAIKHAASLRRRGG